jgi:hypothetical protein
MAQQAFELPRANLRRLMQLSPKIQSQRGTECRAVAAQYGAGSRRGFQRSRPKHPIWYNEMRTTVVCPSKRRHHAYIRFYGPPNVNTPVWVWCSCEHFAYTYEWILAQIGCSSLATGYNSDGVAITNQPPDIRNPQKRPGLCKHLLVAATLALRQTKDFAAEQAEKAQATQPAPKSARTAEFRPNTIIREW